MPVIGVQRRLILKIDRNRNPILIEIKDLPQFATASMEVPHPVLTRAALIIQTDRPGTTLLTTTESWISRNVDFEKQREKANQFRQMHHGPDLLMVPNAWDVANARVFEEAGFGAIATTSAGIAFTLGYPDGQRISREQMLEVVARIAAAVEVPVSADVEAGYGTRPEDAATTARAVIAAGAVGMNLEDSNHQDERSLVDLSLQLEKIAAVREATEGSGIPIVLNARTDIYLLEIGAPESRFDASLHRLSAFRETGADCLFVPGLRDPDTIRRLVAQLQHPVNILAGPGFPAMPELRKLGVARLSLGSGPMRATLGLLQRMARELRSAGTYQTMEGGPSHADVNRMLE